MIESLSLAIVLVVGLTLARRVTVHVIERQTARRLVADIEQWLASVSWQTEL